MSEKPKIITLETGGEHSGNIAASRSRLLQGGTWKKQRIVVIIPAGDLVPAVAQLSWWNLAFPPNNGVAKLLAIGDEVGVAYSQTIEAVLAHPELSKWEYILTIEHDNVPPADGVIRLVESMEKHPHFDCIGGLYFTKGPQGVAQIWGNPKEPLRNYMPQPPDAAGGMVECCGTGMGFNLWRIKMFKDKNLRKPWFKTQTHGGVSTQDLYFWSDARKYGYRCAVDCSIKVGHLDYDGSFGPKGKIW